MLYIQGNISGKIKLKRQGGPNHRKIKAKFYYGSTIQPTITIQKDDIPGFTGVCSPHDVHGSTFPATITINTSSEDACR